MAIQVNNDWHMFMSDDRYEPATNGVVSVLNRPEKKGPVLVADSEWEKQLALALNILDDPIVVNGQEYRYRMYYTADVVKYDGGTPDPVTGYRKMALAVSNDGINWVKPTLNLYNCGVLCSGSSANNLLNAPTIHVFKDFHETNPSRLYKGLSSNGGDNLYVWFSSDGLHWTINGTAALNNICDTLNVLTFDSISGNYVAYVRSWWYHGDRCVSRIVITPAQLMSAWPAQNEWSVTWTENGVQKSWGPLIRADQSDLILRDGSNKGGYYNPAFSVYPFARDILFMLPSYLDETNEMNLIRLAYGRSMTGAFKTDQNDAVLSGTFINRGQIGENDQTIYHMPVFIQTSADKESYYYSGYPGTHNTGIDIQGGLPRMFRAEGRLRGVVTRDTEISATVTSEQLILPAEANKLLINAKVGTGGYIKVAICDSNGTELPSFSLANAVAFTGDSVAAEMAWVGAPNMQALAGQTVRLKWQVTGGGAGNPTKRAAFSFVYVAGTETAALNVSASELGCSNSLTLTAFGFSGTGNYAWSIIGFTGAGSGTSLGATSTSEPINTLLPAGIDGVGSVTIKCERGGTSATCTVSVSCDTGPISPAPGATYSSENPPCIAPARVLPAVNPFTTKLGIRAGDCFDTLSPAQGFPALDTTKITTGSQSLQVGYNSVSGTPQSVATPENVAAVIVCTLFGDLSGANTGDSITVDVVLDSVAYPLLSLIQPAAPGHANAANIEKFFVGPGTHSVSLRAKNATGARGTLNARLITELRLP